MSARKRKVQTPASGRFVWGFAGFSRGQPLLRSRGLFRGVLKRFGGVAGLWRACPMCKSLG